MSAAHKKFDMLDFIHGLRERGVKEDLAEYQARHLAEVIDIASVAAKKEFAVHELATKTDIATLRNDMKQLEVNLKSDMKQLEVNLKNDMKQLEVNLKNDMKQLEVDLKIQLEKYRYDSLRFVIWTGIGVSVFLGGLLAKGFHWLA